MVPTSAISVSVVNLICAAVALSSLPFIVLAAMLVSPLVSMYLLYVAASVYMEPVNTVAVLKLKRLTVD